MKKTREKEVLICDGCLKEQAYLTRCLHCNTEHCYDCKQTRGVGYNHGVHFSGSGDGYYCNGCDDKLLKDGANHRYNAYRKIRHLRMEQVAWIKDFDARVTIAERILEEMEAA